MAGKLTEKQRRFVEAYMGEACGNAGKAYKLAGYTAGTDQVAWQGGCRMLRNVEVQHAIEQRVGADPLVAGRVEIQRFFTEVMLGTLSGEHAMPNGKVVRAQPSFRERVRAAELLAKSQAMFTERVQHSGPDSGPIPVEQVAWEMYGVRLQRPDVDG